MGNIFYGLLRSPRVVCGLWDHQVVIFLCFGFVSIPLSVEEVVLWVCSYPSCEEVIVIGLVLYLVPLSEEVIVIWLSALSLLCRGCFVGERSCVLLVCICQILSGGSLCGKSCVDDIVEILLCEGGDEEQCLEPQNISLYLWLIHYLLTLSLISCIDSYCSYHICLVLFVCLTCVKSRVTSNSTSTLI